MLTNFQVKALKPAAKRYLKTDDRGLCIDVLPSGIKSWVFRYRVAGKQEKIWLGQYPVLSLAEARIERDRLAQDVRAGKSPAAEKRLRKGETRAGSSTNPTVAEFCGRYYREVIEFELKDPAQVKRYLDVEICPVLGKKLLRDVTTLDVRGLIYAKRDRQQIATARHLRGVLKRVFEYAIHEELVPTNPVVHVATKFIGGITSRERALTRAELRIFLRTVDQAPILRQYQVVLRLLLLTLVRKGELLNARWEQLDLAAGAWEIPATSTKMGQAHVVYLAPQVVNLFHELKVLAGGSELVVPGRDSSRKPVFENTLNRVLDRLQFDMPPFTIHDLRRSASSILNGAGFLDNAVELALGHKIPGVKGVYNKAKYADERRAMLIWWADEIDRISGAKLLVGNFG